jgi:hypothetical protein
LERAGGVGVSEKKRGLLKIKKTAIFWFLFVCGAWGVRGEEEELLCVFQFGEGRGRGVSERKRRLLNVCVVVGMREMGGGGGCGDGEIKKRKFFVLLCVYWL